MSGRRSFIRQMGWSFTARLVSAVLQSLVIVQLARGLPPSEFARVATANVIMLAVVPLNGFGLLRELQYRRSVDTDDPLLPAIFDVCRWFTMGSAVIWAVVCVCLAGATGHHDFDALSPIAVWLFFEQVTTLWNAISTVDGRAKDLMSSYLWRRAPVVIALAVALWRDWDVVWAWSASLAVGSALAFAAGQSAAPDWARRLLPRWVWPAGVRFNLGFWWSEVGSTMRDFDVAVISLANSTVGGLYALPARLVRPMNLVTVAAASAAFPRIARLRVVNQRQLLLGCVLGTVPVAAVAGVIVLFAPVVPRLVGHEYENAVPALRVLALSAVVVGFAGLVLTFLQARSTAANRFAGQATMVIAIVQLVACAVTARHGDATDCAWAATVVVVVGTVGLYVRAMLECGVEAEHSGTPAGGETAKEDPPVQTV